MTFSYAAYKDSIREFAETVPQLLLRHPSTAPLALKISELGISSALASRFTVAIIGQMRSGKSTLLNALIGQRLAPVGVKETTATINWFRHGKNGECHTFRVHWADGSTEDRPLSEVNDWIGHAENAQRTRALDFFAPSDFLATANVVDTPGTRSIIDTHQSAAMGFLAEELERETLRYGGRADAIVYVVNPVAKTDDLELLEFFGEKTRLPGASAINSIAVVQKWEHLRPDPLVKIRQMCERMRGQLEGKVSEVLPVSGFLALTAIETPLSVWEQVARLGLEAEDDIFEDLTSSPDYFCDDLPDAPVDTGSRKNLFRKVPWPALRFTMWLARSRRLNSGAALKAEVLAVSNVEHLKRMLDERFFSLGALIQAGTALRKAWGPCRIGMLTFRDQIDRRRSLQEQGLHAIRLLDQTNTNGLDPVVAYVRRSLEGADVEIKHLSEAHRRLDELFHREERNFRLLDLDVWCLHKLADEDLAPEERQELLALSGQLGPEVRERLGLVPDAPRETALDCASHRHSVWKSREIRAHGDQRKIFAHAVERLETILDHLEEEA